MLAVTSSSGVAMLGLVVVAIKMRDDGVRYVESLIPNLSGMQVINW